MNKISKILLLVVASAIALEAAVVPSKTIERERKGFKLLGSLKKTRVVTKFGITAEIQEDWRYWESVNAAGWAEAARDCRANGDTLLYLETSEEVENVTRWLQDTDNTGSLYWIGGKFDTRSGAFIWDNGVPLSPESPWGVGEPKLQKPNTRVSASTIGREIELRAQANTVASRYICEGPWSEDEDGDGEKIPEPCFKDNDLLIVVDSSGSIDDEQYQIAKEFSTRLASTWVDHTGSRVAVQIFANVAEAIFSLTDDQSVSAIKDKIYNMRHIMHDTRTHLGLNLAIDEIVRNNRDVLKNIVLLTDGGTNPPQFKPDTAAAAARANSLGIRTFSVGIGSNIDQAELLSIAGGNQDHVFTKEEFDELLTILRPLSKKMCEE